MLAYVIKKKLEEGKHELLTEGQQKGTTNERAQSMKGHNQRK